MLATGTNPARLAIGLAWFPRSSVLIPFDNANDLSARTGFRLIIVGAPSQL